MRNGRITQEESTRSPPNLGENLTQSRKVEERIDGKPFFDFLSVFPWRPGGGSSKLVERLAPLLIAPDLFRCRPVYLFPPAFPVAAPEGAAVKIHQQKTESIAARNAG